MNARSHCPRACLQGAAFSASALLLTCTLAMAQLPPTDRAPANGPAGAPAGAVAPLKPLLRPGPMPIGDAGPVVAPPPLGGPQGLNPRDRLTPVLPGNTAGQLLNGANAARDAPAPASLGQITLTSVDPTTVTVAWPPMQGATLYRVYRDGIAIADRVSPATTFDDDRLGPSRSYTYHVEALKPAKNVLQPPPASPGAGAALAPALLWTIGISQKLVAMTPAVEMPHDIGVVVLDRASRRVRVSWRAPTRWASKVQILRNGVEIASVPVGRASSYDDIDVPGGNHAYALQTLYEPRPGSGAASPISSPLSLRLAPFRMLAFGDSIMWGQGLLESSKFTSLTRDALRLALNVDVELRSFAHSGAIAVDAPQQPPALDQAQLVTAGEIPNSYPTVMHQVTVQAMSSAVKADEVDLVLVDGCANDVDVLTVLNPVLNPAPIQSITKAKCDAMIDVVQAIHARFRNAAIIVTGYYPIIAGQTDLRAVSVLLAGAAGFVGLVAPLAGVPLDPVSLAIAAAIASEANLPALRAALTVNSAAFAGASNASLANVAATINQRTNIPGLVTFVPLPLQPNNAYASPASWLWLVPSGLYPGDQDEVGALRRVQCSAPGAIDRSLGAPFATIPESARQVSQTKCPLAAMGHPNRAGARAYADAIWAALQARHLPRWRALYSATRPAAP